MSIRAKTAAVIASAGVLAAGWAAGTANGATVATGGTTTTTGSTNTGSTTTNTGSTTNSGSSSSGSYKDGTYTGATINHAYGSVTVTVTISGGKITDVSAKYTDPGDRRSSSIDQQAIPMMKSQVLQAQSANVSTVGGATFTTGAYISSLQSALSKAAA